MRNRTKIFNAILIAFAAALLVGSAFAYPHVESAVSRQFAESDQLHPRSFIVLGDNKIQRVGAAAVSERCFVAGDFNPDAIPIRVVQSDFSVTYECFYEDQYHRSGIRPDRSDMELAVAESLGVDVGKVDFSRLIFARLTYGFHVGPSYVVAEMPRHFWTEFMGNFSKSDLPADFVAAAWPTEPR